MAELGIRLGSVPARAGLGCGQVGEQVEDVLEIAEDGVVDGEVAVENLLQVSLDVSEAEMESLEGLELVCDAGGEGADCYVADIAQEMLDANLLGFFGLDDRWSVDEGPGCGGSVLVGRNVSTVRVFRLIIVGEGE